MPVKHDIEDAAAAIRGASRIAIISHTRPDGDALGANLGLGAALRGMGKTVFNLCEDAIPAKFCYMAGYSGFNRPPEGEIDLAVAVDCGDLLRLGACAGIFRKAAQTVNIDHHISNDTYAKFNIVKYYASTCEIILELLPLIGAEMTPEIAVCLYTGLSTDTGNFMHGNTDSHALSAAAELAEFIPDISAITTVLYKEMPKARLLLLGEALPTVRFFLGDRTAIMTVRREMIDRAGADASMTEGFVDYTINVSGVEAGVCLLEAGENSFKVSFRSKSLDVCAVAERFGGGGHRCAAGCRINGFYEDILDRIVREVAIALEAREQETRGLRP